MPKFRAKPVIIEAVQITSPMTLETQEGIIQGEPGDWLITSENGEQYICKNATFRKIYEPLDKALPPEIKRLTPREKTIASLVAKGYSYKDVATKLGISPKTVHNHVTNILRKLNLYGRFQLAWYMQSKGLYNL